MKKDHEQRLCETVIALVAARTGQIFTFVESPDALERQSEAVDFLYCGVSGELALEVTRVESFPEQITDDHQFVALLEPLEAELSGSMPTPGHYDLVVYPCAVRGAKDGPAIRAALAEWIRKKAPTLQVGSRSTAPYHHVQEIPPGVPFKVDLGRWPSMDGKFFIARFAPKEIEEQRRLRIRKALEDKCPKLQAAKGWTRTSVLILESNDIALGSYVSIADAVVEELAQRQDIPDQIYLVETETPQWQVWVLKEGPHWFPHVPGPGPHYPRPRSG